jgi:hypothetical protein
LEATLFFLFGGNFILFSFLFLLGSGVFFITVRS